MNETNTKILELIKENYTLNDITKELGLSRKQLYYRLVLLKNKGYQLKQNFYENGETTLSFSTCFDLNKDNEIDIITAKNRDEFRVLAISDLHFGNELERLDLVNRAYNYCIKKGINIILCGGDFIDGGFTKGDQKFDTIYEQIDYFIKIYDF